MKSLPSIALASLVVAASPVLAQESGTLEKIRASKTITIGNRDASIPFSYTDGSGVPVGYAIDICMKVVDAVKQKLNLPNLQIKFQTVTSQNRIPLVVNGTVDLECGSTTNSMVRQEQVAFGPSYIMVGVSAAVKKSSGINSFADLAGKTISTTTGTTSIPLLRAYRKNDNLEVREVYGKDHSDSFLLLHADRVSAFVMDDVLLAGQIAASPKPGDYKILPEVLRQEPYGIMLRKDDPQFKGLVDVTIKDLMKSGKINELYAKWFTSPIPPRGVNLNFPMTEATRDLYRHPTDKGI
ncbi:transporter substrate-binding domain-containing protein [Variovorax sp. 2RAF20]|uniref:transporter substrate-binding domain-containing protein n=1 Tax=Variovorax sp. CF313 TaxID=1144315 RepID=UPI0002714E28|nr:transporter substrate-binding domain-containing protein [Variovorax sp. CF313]EJL69553.1 periplasmic component of amino acid ABC-type transporter/signal transduction system [Variovorax sp. CF313]